MYECSVSMSSSVVYYCTIPKPWRRGRGNNNHGGSGNNNGEQGNRGQDNRAGQGQGKSQVQKFLFFHFFILVSLHCKKFRKKFNLIVLFKHCPDIIPIPYII